MIIVTKFGIYADKNASKQEIEEAKKFKYVEMSPSKGLYNVRADSPEELVYSLNKIKLYNKLGDFVVIFSQKGVDYIPYSNLLNFLLQIPEIAWDTKNLLLGNERSIAISDLLLNLSKIAVGAGVSNALLSVYNKNFIPVKIGLGLAGLGLFGTTLSGLALPYKKYTKEQELKLIKSILDKHFRRVA